MAGVIASTAGLFGVAALGAKVAISSGYLNARSDLRYLVASIATGVVIVAACTVLTDRFR